MRQSPESSWAYFAFVCSIAVACAGAAAGGERGGGKSGGNHGGGGNSAGSHGGGGNSAGSHHGEGRKGGAHKGPGDDPSGSSSRSPVDDDRTSTTATAAVAATSTATAVARSAGTGRSLDLPANLQPPNASNSPSTVSPIKALPGVPDEVVRACRDAIELAAAPFGATSVRVSSAGSMRRLGPDTISAPVEVSIDYGRQGKVETRQAPIRCELNATGGVIGLT